MKELQLRLFDFGVGVLKYVRKIPFNPENKIIRDQLGRSATAPGASYEEAQGGCTLADFHNKINICLKETREANYWLRMLENLNGSNDELQHWIRESAELMKIFGSISSKTKPKKFKS